MTQANDLAAPKPARRGRPARTAERPPVVTTEATRCPKCGSTDRGRYVRVRETEVSGVRDGRPFTHVVRRWTNCAACGQNRVDRAYENRTGP